MPIRRATIDDLPALAELFDGYRESYGQTSDVTAATTFLGERLQREESVVLLAIDGDDVVGFTQLYPSFSSVAMQSIWVLNDLFVSAPARRRGYGRALLEAAVQHGTQTGARRLVLATAVDNAPARTLYESMGWIEDEVFRHYGYEL